LTREEIKLEDRAAKSSGKRKIWPP
jgi:hypothetical protein